MSEIKKSVLVVDDDPGIRETLAIILANNGFEVTTAATVSEALGAINMRFFDLLVSDLNIGEPGDGFTVASAMRRRWPSAITLICTGYPDFQAALEAIREQVDDYLVKPIEPRCLLELISNKMQAPVPVRRLPPTKRVADVIRENKEQIIQHWLSVIKSRPEFTGKKLSDNELVGYLPSEVEELARMLDLDPSQAETVYLSAAWKHGETRSRQNYTVGMVIEEIRLVECCIYDALKTNLLEINISQLIQDVIHVSNSSRIQLREAMRSFSGERGPSVTGQGGSPQSSGLSARSDPRAG
jgi:ActR/RegA family two-component response regulator